MARKKNSSLVSKTNSRGRKAKKVDKTKKKEPNQLNIILLFASGLFLFFLVFIEGQNLWKMTHDIVLGLFGILAYFVGILVMVTAILFSFKSFNESFRGKLWQFITLFILICTQVQVCFHPSYNDMSLIDCIARIWNDGVLSSGGGIVGGIVGLPLEYAVGKSAAIVVNWILIFVFSLILTGSTLIGFFKTVYTPVKKIEKSVQNIKKNSKFNIDIPIGDSSNSSSRSKKFSVPSLDGGKKTKRSKEPLDIDTIQNDTDRSAKSIDAQLDNLVERASMENKDKNFVNGDSAREYSSSGDYVFPSLNFLKKSKSTNNMDVSGELRANADCLVDTLKSFGVETRIINICRGPSVTRYELQPSAGVKISKITNLTDDISLNLAAGGVRIEAPIPNKAAVGIEVPNKTKDMVSLREIVSSEEFSNSKSFLSFALGKDIAGNVKIADIAKMPHILIAGATGSGKSVCINSIIVSLLYKSSPEHVRLLMIDPKVVELGVYNGIPHLLVPVVTDPKKAAGALGWAVTEMLSRYKIFAETGVRDLKSYNRLVKSGKVNSEGQPYSNMPQIVIIIDELADLMMVASREVEDSICRLAQMARAAGMHLVIATQRPSVDVITGVIKANIPSRIAFTVSSQVDSRTIIDSAGAEKLLGKGDMLYCPMDQQKPVRVQGCFVSDEEVESVVDFIKSNEQVEYSEEIIEEIDKQSLAADCKNQSGNGGGFEDQDPMIPAAIEVVVESEQASTSFLQRRLKLGYARAARIMDELESRGIVGPQCGSKSRQILISKQQFLEMQLGSDE